MQPVVDLQRVSVRYGRQWALRDVSATFPSGAVGLLGPNGAGKSTMIKALLGLLPPNAGDMKVLGLDVKRAPLQIRQRKVALAVAAVGGPEQREQRRVLRDRQELAVAERPALRGEVERKDANLGNERIGHGFSPHVGLGKIPNSEMMKSTHR